jgi:hypothetical protein
MSKERFTMEAIFFRASDSLVLALEFLRIVALAARPRIMTTSKPECAEWFGKRLPNPIITPIKSMEMKTSRRQSP